MRPAHKRKVKSLIDMAGGIAALSLQLKKSHHTVEAWSQNGIPERYWGKVLSYIPKKHQITIEDFFVANEEIRKQN